MTRKSQADGMDPLLAAALRGERDPTQARPLARRGPEAVTLMLLALAQHIAEQDTTIAEQDTTITGQDARLAERDAAVARLQSSLADPHSHRPDSSATPATPSGMIPVYEKPAAHGGRGVERLIA